MSEVIRIGSRGSQLALWQANHVATLLRSAGRAVEIEVIRTEGDRLQTSESPFGAGKGIFTKEIEEALADGRVDLAVHSLKDLPTELDPRFTLAAIPARADARDAWVCEQYWALHTLPQGGRIGTTSPRRQAMILALRPDVTFVEMRGNVDTRLRKLAEGECDALVLACAGLDRLGRTESVHYRFTVEEICPAPGQGAMALETRAPEYAALSEPGHDEFVRRAVAQLDDTVTRFAVDTERTVLEALGGGCQLPLGAYCRPILDGSRTAGWNLHTQIVASDGEQIISATIQASADIAPVALGMQAATELKSRGALELLAGLSRE
jgi:hydroxymethylbilane synthase